MDLILILLGMALLVFGAEIMVKGAVDLAFRARISPLVVGLTVVSLGTSAPELLVSIAAAINGTAAIALGNVVGSNIANITLVLGSAVLIFPVVVDREVIRVHWPVMMGASALAVLLLWDGQLHRWEGAVLLTLAVLFVWGIVHRVRRGEEQGEPVVPARATCMSVLFVVAGIAAAGWGADLFVQGAVGFAHLLGASDQLIGLTVVAVGTSLPELITSLVAAFRKQPDISLGNLVGSNILNILCILGITALVAPIDAGGGAFRTDLLVMVAMALLLLPLMYFGRSFGRGKGLVLLMAYTAYVWMVMHRG
jgi:cation:H+ antiporter